MNLDRVCQTVNCQLIESQNHPLSSTEITILRGIWQYQTYTQIAIAAGYSPGYFTTVVAPELYQRLAKIIGQRVTKKNCRRLLESHICQGTISPVQDAKQTTTILNIDRDTLPCYPSGSVPLNSPLYLKRSWESRIEREIEKPGALVRIKAPREMGKTSLMLRNLDYAKHLGYQTVSLNLEQVENSILNDLNLFLRWLCANISRLLQREPKLEEYWDEDLGSTISCTLYLQDYILESLDTPLVLALDEVNKIFEHPQVAKDFLPLLRSWYEEGKRLVVWQKLRLIVVHSTEIYVPLQLDQSPFNVGLPIRLDDFNLEEVEQLAQRYGLEWKDGTQASRLMSLVGGHPALINLALYYLGREEMTLSQLLETAPTATGIYAHHLQRHRMTLEKNPELAQALDRVLSVSEPVVLAPINSYKLASMGLIKQSGDKAIASCELYRQYFSQNVRQNLLHQASLL
ncbi:AAA-like domain-containing protein [Pleurocapsa sp. PCC 7319]|uniref:AAA-like domain-containing protein n=1 Tax=Pleurocapsa sp. PCC 7319 TaxID=118161 RepID=UPI0003449838|nr:AAA-like domain-containing protein [Pleurocapsa sp. PCC 7319]